MLSVNNDNEVSTGSLSDSEIDVDQGDVNPVACGQNSVNHNVPDNEIRPTKLSRDSKPDISSVATKPKKLKPSFVARETGASDNPAEHDATEYLTLPSSEAVVKSDNEQESPVKSEKYLTPASSLPVSSNITPVKNELKHSSKIETQYDVINNKVAKHYKLSVDLANVLMLSKDFDSQDGILAYKVRILCPCNFNSIEFY